MFKQLINNATGEFTINNGFVVSNITRLSDLLIHFGEEELIQSKYISNCYYTNSQFAIDSLFFKFNFSIKNECVIKIGFEIETEPIPRNEWRSNCDLETAWIAKQMNDTTKFNWDNNPEFKQYILNYNWGSIGIFFDFKNGTYESFLTYKSIK